MLQDQAKEPKLHDTQHGHSPELSKCHDVGWISATLSQQQHEGGHRKNHRLSVNPGNDYSITKPFKAPQKTPHHVVKMLQKAQSRKQPVAGGEERSKAREKAENEAMPDPQ